jgi:hypothetical protein
VFLLNCYSQIKEIKTVFHIFNNYIFLASPPLLPGQNHSSEKTTELGKQAAVPADQALPMPGQTRQKTSETSYECQGCTKPGSPCASSEG